MYNIFPTPHSPLPTPHFVFVYGTLKPGEINYQRYCIGKVVAEERAIALGQLYALPMGYPAMTLGNYPVQGFLLEFAEAGILPDLDRLEGYQPLRPATQNEYNRRQIEIYQPEGRTLGIAWAYLMRIEQVCSYGGILLPSGYWTATV